MNRATVVVLALICGGVCGCAGSSKLTKRVSKTVCEVWIYTMPHGARLYVNERYAGRTPFKYTAINDGDSSAHFIARDLSELIARKRGYDEEAEVITVANCYEKLNIENEGVDGQVKRYKGHMTLYLAEKEGVGEREYGNVVIQSVPEESNAEIYLNDSLIGSGKTSLLKLPHGSYVLKVCMPGYRKYVRIISVLADNDVTITANLEKTAEGEGDGVSQLKEEMIETTPAGEETELEEDLVPGTIGGKD